MVTEKNNPPIILVCGRKNSGKTTLLEKLIPVLKQRGLQVALIKHDRHGFDCDVEGTDSDRLRRAGAYGTIVVQGGHVFMNRYGETEPSLEELAKAFPEADLILAEGYKGMQLPKVELIRRACFSEKEIKEKQIQPVSEKRGRFLIVTDFSAAEAESFGWREERIGLEDICLLAEGIQQKLQMNNCALSVPSKKQEAGKAEYK